MRNKLLSIKRSRKSSRFYPQDLKNILGYDDVEDASSLIGSSDLDRVYNDNIGTAMKEKRGDHVGRGVHFVAGKRDTSANRNVTCCARGTITNTESPSVQAGHVKFFNNLADDRGTCLRVSFSTALIILGIIMFLTCCCALLLRNRIFACFGRCRGKKKKKNQHYTIDEEQGMMGPRKVQKGSGRKGGGFVDVVNIGTQNSDIVSNPSVESDAKPTGCCNKCYPKRKKKRSKKPKS